MQYTLYQYMVSILNICIHTGVVFFFLLSSNHAKSQCYPAEESAYASKKMFLNDK